MISRLLAVVALAFIAAGVIVLIHVRDVAPMLTMQDGSGHP